VTNVNSGIAFDTMKTLKKAFKKKTPVLMSQNFNVMPISVVNNNLLRYDPLSFVAQVTSDKGTITVAREQNAGVRTPIRFLQWGQNCCTGFEVDPGARVVFSGPFSGCSFLIAKDPHSSQPVMLHSNDNSNQGAMNRAGTLATQLARANAYLGVYHNGAAPLYHCSYEEMGMVPSWIFAVDLHGDQRSWDIYCVNLMDGGIAPYRRLGGCLIL
jgi:hypothetical protein